MIEIYKSIRNLYTNIYIQIFIYNKYLYKKYLFETILKRIYISKRIYIFTLISLKKSYYI